MKWRISAALVYSLLVLTAPAQETEPANRVTLVSTPGDPAGGGVATDIRGPSFPSPSDDDNAFRGWLYDRNGDEEFDTLFVHIEASSRITLEFSVKSLVPTRAISVGEYDGAVRSGTAPEISINRDGGINGCFSATGSFTITELETQVVSGTVILKSAVVDFEQQCFDLTGTRLGNGLTGTLQYLYEAAGAGDGNDDDDQGEDDGDGEENPPAPPPPPPVQLRVSNDFDTAPLLITNSATQSIPFTSTIDSTFNSDLHLFATSDAQEHEDFHVSLNTPIFAAPGSGEGEVTIRTGPMTFPRTYTVTLHGTDGTRTFSRSFQVAVTCDPPVILGVDQPKSVGAVNGAHFDLEVRASGSGPFFYQWYRGVPGMTRWPVMGATGAKMTTFTHENSYYWVRVSNACGSVDSRPAEVTVTTGLRIPRRSSK